MAPGAPPGAPRGPLGAPPAPGRPRERPGGSPGRPLGEPIWVKNGLEIPLGRFWKLPKFFGGPGGSPRALGERFLESRNVCLRALGFQLVFRTILGSINEPREAPGTFKIKVFVWTVCEFRDFRIFKTNRRKEA